MSGINPTARAVLPNATSDEPSQYKANIDAAINAQARIGFAFAPSAQDTPNMTVRLEAGAIFGGTALTEVAAQSTGTIAAPTTNPRIDRVVIDKTTGAVSVITGTPGASPSPPDITTGKLPVAQVLLTVGMTAITNADITDERVPGGAGVTIGSIASPSPTEVPSTQDVATALATVQDTEARDLASFHAFISQIAASRATGPVPKGGMWTFFTDEMTKTNAFWTSGAGYMNGSQVTTSTGTGAPYGTNVTHIDRTTALPNNTPITKLGFHAGSASSGYLWIFKRNSSTSYTPVASVAFSHTGSGWEFFSLASAFITDASSTYYIGIALPSGGTADYKSVNNVGLSGTTYTIGTPISVTEGSGVAPCPAYEYAGLSMTLESPAGVSLGFTPTKATLYLLQKSISSVTYNTDLIVKASRGSGWATASDLAKVCAFDATYDLLKASIDLSALASGSTGLWGLNTYNSKAQRVRAALVLFE